MKGFCCFRILARLMQRGLVILALATTTLIIFTACSSNGDDIYQETTVTTAATTATSTEPSSEEAQQPDGLQGTITILVSADGWGLHNNDLVLYSRMFNEIHPGVEFVFDSYQIPTDVAQNTALTTRLIANPPDILQFGPDAVSFERLQHEAILADLNTFIDGERGINRNDYFDNIFRAIEVRGSLFYLPLYFSFQKTFLNQRFFDGIGVDTSEIKFMTLDEELDFYMDIVQQFPGEPVYMNRQFSMLQVLSREPLYSVETRTAYATSPAVERRMNLAAQIPLGAVNLGDMSRTDGVVVFEPDGATVWFSNITPLNLDTIFLQPNNNITWLPQFGLWSGGHYLIFLQGHPDMQFSAPVLLTQSDGGVQFASNNNLAIMRDAQNPELAWEFLRFMLEFEDNMYNVMGRYDAALGGLPVNRNRFENQLSHIFNIHYQQVMHATNASSFIEISGEEHRLQTLAATMDFFRMGAEMANREIRRNNGILNALVYPDIWLLYSGQQDVARTLANIQNRLELYVHE